jgi:hypothetical protein
VEDVLMKKRLVTALICGTLVLAAFSVSYASIFMKIPFSQLVQKSNEIAQGKVISLKSEWNDQHTMIFTYVTFEVQSFLKNSARKPETVVVKELGGQVDDITSAPIGFPQFTIGQETILFLHTWNDGSYRVLEYCQGKYNIYQDAKTHEKMVQREDIDQKEVALVGDVAESDTFTKPVTLKYLISRIQMELKK